MAGADEGHRGSQQRFRDVAESSATALALLRETLRERN